MELHSFRPCLIIVTCCIRKLRSDVTDATRENVKKEMAKPRVARSARIAELKLDATRIPERPSTTMSGIVDKIIASPRPSQPEQANIVLDAPDKLPS